MANDFSKYVGVLQLTNDEKLIALEEHFKPHKLYQFPTRLEYDKQRSCKQAWLDEYNWLVYSPAEDGVYCKLCALFSDSSKISRLVKLPLTVWTTATEKFKKHAASENHRNASVLADNFLRIMKSKQKSIGEQLNTAMATRIESNRQKLYPIIKTIIFCGKQNISLRGHREDMSLPNPGNFRALLNFRVESGDQVLKDHLQKAPRNATYISNTIQNEIIVTVGKWMQKVIVKDIREGSRVFSIIADEGRDCSNKEQMPLIIRYVDKHLEIQESFMGFVECVGGTTGMLLAELIEASCLSIGLDLNLCRGQGYDGAGNMAGHCSGAAKIMQLKYPKAVYFHCASHKLNLCVAHSCKLASVANMMSVISSIANFLTTLQNARHH